ncbi:uncharacterized protein PG986_014026 [Apiospora aurea]|uniref:Uncharacterized protein n=1 Tax=Apiospora aurea TaxID=335848 RepID=A0ABR1PX88_9PEZI
MAGTRPCSATALTSAPACLSLVPRRGPNPVTETEECMQWYLVESADLEKMAITSYGTVIFYSSVERVLVASQQALNLGPMMLCGLENDGQIMVRARVWPFTPGRPWPDDGWDAATMIRECDLNMSPGISKSPDVWLDCIERYAPGYLGLEAEGDGMVCDCDHGRLKTTEVLENVDLEDDEVYPSPGRK